MADKHRRYVQELFGHACIFIMLDTEGMDGGPAEAMDEAL